MQLSTHCADYYTLPDKPCLARSRTDIRIPGPIVGGAWPSGVNAPLAVSEEYWHHACDDRKVVVPRADVHDHVSTWFVDAITTGWVNKLHSLDHEQCIEAGGDGGPPYTWV